MEQTPLDFVPEPGAFASRPIHPVRAARVVGVALILLGIAAILLPFVAGIAVNYLVACALLLGAIALAGLAVGGGHTTGQKLLGVLAALVLFVGGIGMMVQPVLGLYSLTAAVSAYLFASGLARIMASIMMPPHTGRGSIAVGGVIGVILGALLLYWLPRTGPWAIGTLVGVDLLISGIVIATAAGRLARAIRPPTVRT
jgi:uncharacterized membrane protein HdeD (DUF308 family)